MLVKLLLLALLALPLAAKTEYTIITVAGNGDEGYNGDGGDARCASLNRPTGVDVDAGGFVYIADYNNNRIRRLAPDGTITTVAGSGQRGFSGDGGPATAAQLAGPYGVRVVEDGFLIADAQNGRIRHVNRAGTISTIASGFEHPVDVVRGPDGRLYVAEGGGNRVRRIEADGTLTAVAGSGRRRYNGDGGYSGDGGPAVDAQLNVPGALTFDQEGNLIIADLRNHVVRKVDRNGVITTIAGTGVAGSAGDGGPARQAELSEPGGLAWEPDGSLIISEIPRVRRLTKDGRLVTVAGSDKRGFYGDHGPATNALLSVLDLIAIDGAGNVFVADYRNNRVRKLIPATAATAPQARPRATADVEALLARMRAAYRAIESAEMSFVRIGMHSEIKGALRYAKSATVDATLEVAKVGRVIVTSDGRSIRTVEPALPEHTTRFTLDALRRAMAANLEVISLWDSARQLETAHGGNMAGPDLRIAERETWNGREWLILEEKAGETLYRYFIDPQSSLIWRTVTTNRDGAVIYDGRVEALTTK